MLPPVFRPRISGEIRQKLAVDSRSQSSEDESPSVWNLCKFYFLERETQLLMKLEDFAEAVRVLEDVTNTSASESAQNRKLALSIRNAREMLHECYMQMSRRAAELGDVQRAKEFDDLARRQLRLFQPTPIEILGGFDIRFLLPTASPLGSSGLGLTQAPARKGAHVHMSKLPKPIMELLERQYSAVQYSQEVHDGEKAILLSERMREVLKMIKRCLASGTYDWLLSWVDLPLARLYHYCARKFDKALEIWKEIQECSVRKSECTDKLEVSSTDYQIPFAALEYELSFSNASVRGKQDIVQTCATAYRTSEEKAEQDLCFWLYFGYYCHGNFQGALEWLQTSKNLRLKGRQTNGGCPRRRGPRLDYLCCDYDYNRCEIDLFTKLERHEEATNALESLLRSKECVQESGIIDCINNDLLVDESILGQLPTPSPTATGCIFLKWSNGIWSRGFPELVQSSVGLEHHFLKLPFPIQLAFRKHSSLGRLYNLEWMDWENAIFHFEWCLEIFSPP